MKDRASTAATKEHCKMSLRLFHSTEVPDEVSLCAQLYRFFRHLESRLVVPSKASCLIDFKGQKGKNCSSSPQYHMKVAPCDGLNLSDLLSP